MTETRPSNSLKSASVVSNQLSSAVCPVCRELLQPAVAARKGSAVLPESSEAEPSLPRGLDSDGPRVHGDEEHLCCHPGLQVRLTVHYGMVHPMGPGGIHPPWFLIVLCMFSLFRHAIEVNKRDYRAWYGLGQTYEILKMPFYCLYYYRKAHQLRCAFV